MKRSLSLLLTVVMVLLALSGCGKQGQTVIQNGGDTKISEGEKDVSSAKQGFSTKCLDIYDTKEDGEGGLYIYTGPAGSIPYIYIYRMSDMPIDAGQFLEESVAVGMQEQYGDDLIEMGEKRDYTFGDIKAPGIRYTYKVDDNTVTALCVCLQEGGDIIQFTAKYLGGSDKLNENALDTAVKNFKIGTADKPADDKKEEELKITPSEVSQVVYVDYADPSGYFTAEIPQGWDVRVGIKPSGEYDLISYAVSVSDPKNPDRQLYLNLNCAAGVKTEEAHEWYKKYYGADNLFAMLPVVGTTTQSFFEGMKGYYDYTDFTLLENLGQSALGGDVLTANCTSSLTGKKLEGVFTAWIVDNPYIVQKDMFNYAAGTVDAGPISAYTIITETAPEEEFIDWQPVLARILSSISFTEKFQSERQAQWKQVMGTASYLSQTANEMSNMIMSSWESRNKTYDVASQKYSDATLGYDRVLDTETGEYYRAKLGFDERNKNERYKVVNDDAAYLSPISGYIE